MQDDYTLIKEVKQIRAGEYAIYKEKNWSWNFIFIYVKLRKLQTLKKNY